MPREEREQYGLDLGAGLRFKQVAVAMGLIFALTLAVVVGKQMSAEAMAVVVGVVCGVAAAVPTSVLLLVVLTRSERRRLHDQNPRQARAGQYPPVIVIQGGQPQALPSGPYADYWPGPLPGPRAERSFQVVGGEELADDNW
jgi:hypothetical protein